jgi:hypothetical protein
MLKIKKKAVQPKSKPAGVSPMPKTAKKAGRPAVSLPFVVSAANPIPRSYAGKYVAMLPDGRTIVAVEKTRTGARLEAASAGYRRVGVTRVPLARSIG